MQNARQAPQVGLKVFPQRSDPGKFLFPFLPTAAAPAGVSRDAAVDVRGLHRARAGVEGRRQDAAPINVHGFVLLFW